MSKLDIAFDPTSQSRIEERSLVAAKSIATEAANTANHSERLALAGRIMTGDGMVILQLTKMVLINTTIAAAVTTVADFLDPVKVANNDIDFELASIWTMFAVALAAQ
jgi:hypothetical protein